MIPADKIEEVKHAADIVDVVADHVKLRRTGSSFTGLCPFHNEKTPSFNVSPSLGIFKCFGCGEGGDVINFVMQMDGVGFEEAVRTLAERYSVVIPEKTEDQYDPQQHLKDGIYHALRFAGNFFHQNLAESDDAEYAREYLKKRGYPWKTVRKYGLGYASDRFDSLLKNAESAGINMQYLHESGLVKAREDDSGFYDTFRSRLMFPIFNPSGKVIGFGGRTLSSDKKIPKYINSPQTPVYNKSEVLYGIHTAKNEIRKAGEAILVEGYTDVISMHQGGIGNVVSTSGTSLTAGQMRVLKRYGEILLMIFDADVAGVKAAVRGISIALEQGMAVRVLTLPEGEDPDSYVREYGGEGFQEYKKKETVDFLHYLVGLAQKEGRWQDPIERRKSINEILEAIAVMPDGLSRANYVQELSSISRIGDRTLLQELEKIRNRIQKDARRTAERAAMRAGREDQDSRRPTSMNQDLQGGARQQEMERHVDASFQGAVGRIPAGAVAKDAVSGEDAVAPTRRHTHPPKRPGYEKELIRLMLTFGDKIIEFIGGYCSENDFEDPELRNCYNDIMTRFQKGDPVSVEVYSRREHPYPELVGEVVLQRHWVSEFGMKKRGVIIHRDANPVNTAQGALKSLKIRYLERTREKFLDKYASASEDEKAEIQKWIRKVTGEWNRHRQEPAETLFPDI